MDHGLPHLPNGLTRCRQLTDDEGLTMVDDPKTLVSTEWLQAHLKDPDLRILDGSYYLPQMGRDPRAEYDIKLLF